MIQNDVIAFAAPSQLRLHLVANAQGSLRLAVMNAFNEPVGALRSLKCEAEDLQKFFKGEVTQVECPNQVAKIVFESAVDEEHQNVKVNSEDTTTGMQLHDVVKLEELKGLLEHALAKAGATVM
jgi:hypothetical protein